MHVISIRGCMTLSQYHRNGDMILFIYAGPAKQSSKTCRPFKESPQEYRAIMSSAQLALLINAITTGHGGSCGNSPPPHTNISMALYIPACMKPHTFIYILRAFYTSSSICIIWGLQDLWLVIFLRQWSMVAELHHSSDFQHLFKLDKEGEECLHREWHNIDGLFVFFMFPYNYNEVKKGKLSIHGFYLWLY